MIPADLTPCRCGRPWRPIADEAAAKVEATIARLGEYVPVHIGARTWLVSRRCIAYHGVTGQQLLSGVSGFQEILHAGSGRGRSW